MKCQKIIRVNFTNFQNSYVSITYISINFGINLHTKLSPKSPLWFFLFSLCFVLVFVLVFGTRFSHWPGTH